MTKKNYIAFAQVIAQLRARSRYDAQSDPEIPSMALIDAMAELFARDNPRFNRTRFVAACKTGE